MRLFTETGAGPAPLSGACGALPEARNPVGERYTDVPARGCESTDAAAATATGADPASARRWAASSEVTSGVAGAPGRRPVIDGGVVTAVATDSPSLLEGHARGSAACGPESDR